MFRLTLPILGVVAALVSTSQSAVAPQAPIKNSLQNPCPELFHYEIYEAGDKPGQWSGNLNVRSDYDLNGVWIRLYFDKEVKELTVDQPNFVIKKGDNRLFKIQSPYLTLKALEEKIFKITVFYEGTEAPSLTEYRLNARTMCPQAHMQRQDVFQGDLKSDYFLKTLNSSNEVIPLPTQYQCGLPHASNPHPWQATVYITINNQQQYACEAILINPSYVITAAHCVTFKNDATVVPTSFLTVYFGQEGASITAVKSWVHEIKVHPGYLGGSLLDDVAILKLAKPVKVTDTVRPVCLGERKGIDVKSAVIIGREYGQEGQVGKLLESNVVMIDMPECVKVAPHLQQILTYETYCVSYKSGDKNCAGGSGSGLITIGNDGVATLEGLVVLGVRLQNQKCDVQSVPVVTELNRYLSFIRHMVY